MNELDGENNLVLDDERNPLLCSISDGTTFRVRIVLRSKRGSVAKLRVSCLTLVKTRVQTILEEISSHQVTRYGLERDLTEGSDIQLWNDIFLCKSETEIIPMAVAQEPSKESSRRSLKELIELAKKV